MDLMLSRFTVFCFLFMLLGVTLDHVSTVWGISTTPFEYVVDRSTQTDGSPVTCTKIVYIVEDNPLVFRFGFSGWVLFDTALLVFTLVIGVLIQEHFTRAYPSFASSISYAFGSFMLGAGAIRLYVSCANFVNLYHFYLLRGF